MKKCKSYDAMKLKWIFNNRMQRHKLDKVLAALSCEKLKEKWTLLSNDSSDFENYLLMISWNFSVIVDTFYERSVSICWYIAAERLTIQLIWHYSSYKLRKRKSKG